MLWSMVSPSTSVSDVHVWDGTRPDRAPRRNRPSHRLARRRVDPPRALGRAPDDRRVRRRGGLLRSHGADLRVGHREPRPGRGIRLRRPRAAAHTCGSRCRSCGWPRRRSTRRHRTWSATRIRRSSPGGCWCTAGTDRRLSVGFATNHRYSYDQDMIDASGVPGPLTFDRCRTALAELRPWRPRPAWRLSRWRS